LKRRHPAGHLPKILALEPLRRWIRFRVIIPIFRSPHSAAYTARGVANGVFWGLTPTIGLQTFEILGTWFVARRVFHRDSSLMQAMIWVWVNNPLTVAPMYYAFYRTGLGMLGETGAIAGYDAFGDLLLDDGRGWYARVSTIAGSIGLPLLIGCLPYAAAGAAVGFYWSGRIVSRRRARLARRRAEYETFRTSDSSGRTCQ
jgi:uncharacterized protein (DUF2062 family)